MTVTITAKAYTYTNGNPNDASQIETDLNAYNANFTNCKTKIDNLLSGNIEDAATLLLNSNYAGSSPGIATLGVERGTLANVYVRYEDTTNDRWEFTNNGTNYNPMLPLYYKAGCKVTFASTSTATIGLGSWADSTNKHVITVASPLTLDITSTGANKLDTGAEASSTWYYVYLIMKSSDGTVAGLLSVTNENVTGSVTLPSGYDLKKQLPIAIRNNGSSNFIDWNVGTGWPDQASVRYNVNLGDNSAVGTNNLLSAGVATTYTDIDCTSLVPPLSQMAIIKYEGVYSSGGSTSFFVRPNGETHDGNMLRITSTSTPFMETMMKTDSGQILEYKMGANTSSGYLWVAGYVVTEI